MNLYIFAGVKETYHKAPVNVAAACYTIGEDAYHFSHAHHTESIESLLASCVVAAIEDIIELDSSVLDKNIRVIVNATTGWDYAMFERLVNAPKHATVVEIITNNKKMEHRESWLAMAEAFTKLDGLNIKTTTKYQETPLTIKEALVCDSAAAQALYHTHVNPDNGLERGSRIEKDRRKKGKGLPNLVVDNYIFNWAPTHEMAIYYTCNTELENKKAKAKKSDPLRDRGFVYYSGDNKRLRIAGRVSACDRYNVVVLKERCEFLESVFHKQSSINANIYSTRQAVMYRKSSLTAGGVGNLLEDGDFSMIGSDVHGDMFTLSAPREDISYVFNPPRLAFKIKRIMEQNTSRLVSVINGSLNTNNYALTDVTDQVFTFDDKGKCKLRPTITTTTKDLLLKDVETPENGFINPKVLLKYDLPTRNELNKIAKDNPKLEILTWSFDPHIIGYAFIITTEAGWLYYSSEYGARHLLRTARKSQRKEK